MESRKGASRRGIPYGINARRRIAAGAENHDFPPGRPEREAEEGQEGHPGDRRHARPENRPLYPLLPPISFLRDIDDLVKRGVLLKEPGGGRSTSYALANDG